MSKFSMCDNDCVALECKYIICLFLCCANFLMDPRNISDGDDQLIGAIFKKKNVEMQIQCK